MSGGLSRRAALPAPVAVAARWAVSRRWTSAACAVVVGARPAAMPPALRGDLRHAPERDPAHVGRITSDPSAFVPDPASAARGLLGAARPSPDAAKGPDVASSGSGSSNHLLVVQFARTAAARLDRVPRRGAGGAMADVNAGVVPLMSSGPPSAAGRVRVGSVRALGISAPSVAPPSRRCPPPTSTECNSSARPGSAFRPQRGRRRRRCQA
jgi:tripartite-type tricarboxylate transporter receptor subunit TctC